VGSIPGGGEGRDEPNGVKVELIQGEKGLEIMCFGGDGGKRWRDRWWKG